MQVESQVRCLRWAKCRTDWYSLSTTSLPCPVESGVLRRDVEEAKVDHSPSERTCEA